MWKLALLFLLAAHPVSASEPEVDLELFLAVDVSRSMSPAELEIQRRGYAEALMSEDVWRAIESGLIGAIALTYVEWAGHNDQRVVVPWTVIASRDDAHAFATRITTHFDSSMRRTSISGALRFATRSFEENGVRGLRRVIDVSGDGPNNSGHPVLPTRDAVVARGITINGLPLMTKDGLGVEWQLEDLDVYYRACVIGGPGAFAIPVLTWEEFGTVVRKKLILEISGVVPERIWRAQSPPAYDCLIGEKIWEKLRERFFLP